MVYVALAEAAVLVVVVLAFTGLLRSRDRAHARREDLILNKLLHSVGRTWTPPPALDAPEPDKAEGAWPSWTVTPEQEPVHS